MQKDNLIKAGLFALFLTIAALLCWEVYLRVRFYSKVSGIDMSYDDNPALWADKRAQVYQPSDQATVFIGSSRMRFDIDAPTWENMTGEKVVQLAQDGGDPRPVLTDLAADSNFKGKLLIDVTEGIFFYKDKEPTTRAITYYHSRTPTQRFSFYVNKALESNFVFLDQENFSINSLLNRWFQKPRPGVIPDVVWPLYGTIIRFDRQEYFTPKYLADTTQSNKTKSIWKFFGDTYPDSPVVGKKLDSLILDVKSDIDKIRARGGQVVFTRTPSDGYYREGEDKNYPRSGYWDRLLAVTGCKGVYYADYPTTAPLICAEWSHLSIGDARIYTRNLVNVLQDQDGWTFNKKSVTQK
jgi:hypothetical protein